MYGKRFLGYVPEPEPVTTDRIIAAHYYPGWVRGGSKMHNCFQELEHFPERCPLLGWYDEANPEVTDWEIKWAVEHGISCFIYCWYRFKSNVGQPVTREALRFGHAIHEGLFRARYRNYIKFAIMFENQEIRWGNPADTRDLLENLLPWWVNEYFSKPNYLKIDGKPVLYVYAIKDLVDSLGGDDAATEAIALLNTEIQKYGFPGIHISACNCGWNDAYIDSVQENRPHDLSYTDKLRSYGFDSAFQYCWPLWRLEITEEQFRNYKRELDGRLMDPQVAIASQLMKIQERAEYAPDFFMFTATVGNDREPWRRIFNYETLTEDPLSSAIFTLGPLWYQHLLEKIRDITDKLPENSIGRKIIVLDAWNEWSEGHSIAPSCGAGFRYLQAVRQVFSKCDNLPDYRTPQMLDFDPYDYEWYAKDGSKI